LVDTNELQTDNIPGTLTTIEGKIDTIDGIVDNILVDTGTTLDGKIDTIDGNVDSILTDTGTTIPATLGSPADTDLATDIANVKTQTDKLGAAHTEPTGVPAANETPLDKIGYLFMALRNKITVTATKKTFYDDGDAAEWEKDLSDNGTTYTETEGNSV